MAVNENHLDRIQAIITRHNSNSFMLKGWTITLVSAIFALAGTLKEPILAIIPVMPILIFWYLDSFYLANERCYVSLYSCAINDYKVKIKNKELKKEKQVLTTNNSGQSEINPEHEIELKSSAYSLNYTIFQDVARNNIRDTFWSVTIRWFYIMLLLFSVLLFTGMIILKKHETDKPINVTAQIENDCLNVKSETPQILINNIMLKDSIISSDTIN